MENNMTEKFLESLEVLGFKSELDDSLFLTRNIAQYRNTPSLWFHLEKADHLNVTAVFFRKTFEGKGEFLPQVYLYDFSDILYDDSLKTNIADIQKKVWSSGEVPLTVLFFSTEIKILDCTVPINSFNYEPVYLVDRILLSGTANHLYNSQFANNIQKGVFWDEEINKGKFNFNNSAYDKLILHLRENVIKKFVSNNKNSKDIIHKLIFQSILIKYLEERKSVENGIVTRVFENDFFQKFGNSNNFCDVLRNGHYFELCTELNRKDKFNGRVFEWNKEEINELTNTDLTALAEALDGNTDVNGQLYFWKQYDFNFIPVEFISRLYEEFIVNEEDSSTKNGKVYTPAHLAKFLVDEAMPLNTPPDLSDYKILDPACGSGIFLVIAFKRLVQWWRLFNDFKKPSSNDLKLILSNSIFGIDIDKKAAQLTAFSLCLAICDELSPKEIWDNLHFDDLLGKNIFAIDFFLWKKDKINDSQKFNLIIGNPPFERGGIAPKDSVWVLKDQKIRIPQNQVALKFLSESITSLKPNGLACLIIKASGLLYNSTSQEYSKALFSNFDVKQILDFTPLARNSCLWDANADVAAVSIFLKNAVPNDRSNILHAIFRRTKASKERIIFEIDDYDMHYVNRKIAIDNPFIWKINLLGGGRIRNVVDKCLEFGSLKEFIKRNQCNTNEGYILGYNGKKRPNFMYKLKYIPTEDIKEESISYDNLTDFNKNDSFYKVPNKRLFVGPKILIKENIGKNRIPVFYIKNKDFAFKDKIVGIYSKDNNHSTLEYIYESFQEYNNLFRFLIFCTSSQILINKNTALLKEDIMRLPIIPKEKASRLLSEIDGNIISDVNNYMQLFLRNGENSDSVKSLSANDNDQLLKFGNEFSKLLNLSYANEDGRFRLSEIIRFKDNKFIGTIFSYDSKLNSPEIINMDYGTKEIEEMVDFQLYDHLRTKRIIKYYSRNKIVIIKPNQKRYWIPLIAYRDADKTFFDFSHSGY